MDVLVSAPGTQCGLQAAAAKFKVYLDTEVSIFLLWCRKKTDLYIKQTTGLGYKR